VNEDANRYAWVIKSLADMIVGDACALTAAVDRDVDADDLRKRVANLLRFTANVERAAEKFLAALEQEKVA
jgi:hypothetical protein